MDLIESGIRNPIEHWYYRHKFWFIKNSRLWDLRKDNYLVDIGAGSGLFSKELIRTKRVKSAEAIDVGYPDDCNRLEDGVLFKRNTSYSGHTHFLLTDVLEHIEDDQQFLSDIVKEADVGSNFIITVPALMSLWSGHDIFLKHYRRYTKKSLIKLVSDSGLNIESVRYTYSTVFLLAYLQRKLLARNTAESQMKDVNPFIEKVLSALLIPDRYIKSIPFGISIFLEAAKNE